MTGGAHDRFVGHGRIKTTSDRKFGLYLGGMLIAFAAVRVWFGHVGPVTVTIGALGAVLVVLGAVAPPLLAPLNRGWMKFGMILAAVVNPLIMFVMFATIFIPIAIFMRFIGRDELRLKRKPTGESYWREREPEGDMAERLKDQF